MAIEEVFQLNGEYVIRTECVHCGVEIHSPVGEEEPSEIVVKSACAMRRTCEDCLDREEAEREKAKRRRVLDKLIVGSGMDPAIRAFKFAEMIREGRREPAIQACEAWSRGTFKKPGVFLWGPSGVGKTRLAATAAWARIQNDSKDLDGAIRWCSVAQLMGNLNRAFADTARRDALSVLLGDGPLVLDDLDKVNPSEFGKQQVFTAIDARVLAGAPLLVTANLPLGAPVGQESIETRFGAAVASRLAGHCEVFTLDGPDRRLELDV